jgi:hypothetical protein
MTQDEEKSLQGWVPDLGNGVTLAEVVEYAFDYRGNVTLIRRDGGELVGYLFNRNADVTEPFVQLFDQEGEAHKIAIEEIENIQFTGRDTAAGQSYEAWKRRKEEEKAEHAI